MTAPRGFGKRLRQPAADFTSNIAGNGPDQMADDRPSEARRFG
ncbi:hypothetical protein VRZ08_22765 [Rhodopseudomonas sp. G2_2311]